MKLNIALKPNKSNKTKNKFEIYMILLNWIVAAEYILLKVFNN